MKNSRVYQFGVSAGVVAAALAGLSTAAHAQTTIISSGATPVNNGGFEAPVLAPAGHAYDPAGATWTFDGSSGISTNSSDDSNFSDTGDDNTQYAFIQVPSSSNDTSSISQTFTIGGSGTSDLAVSFQYAGRLSDNANISGDTLFSAIVNGTTYFSTTTAGSSEFVTETFNVLGVSDSALNTITFSATVDGSATPKDNAALVDNVSVIATPTATPEPGMVVTGLAMLGTTGLGLIRGRRRAKQNS